MRSNSVISERAAYQGRELHFLARFVVTSTDDKLLIKISVFVLIACISNCRKKPQHQNADFLVYLIQWNPDFSNPRFPETPDNSNQFWLPWYKLTLDNSNLRKFPNHLVRMSISVTFTSLPPFSLIIRDFGKQNTRGNVSKISVSLEGPIYFFRDA